jgi:hypothetical protein
MDCGAAAGVALPQALGAMAAAALVFSPSVQCSANKQLISYRNTATSNPPSRGRWVRQRVSWFGCIFQYREV